jgi:hypothetical protein
VIQSAGIDKTFSQNQPCLEVLSKTNFAVAFRSSAAGPGASGKNLEAGEFRLCAAVPGIAPEWKAGRAGMKMAREVRMRNSPLQRQAQERLFRWFLILGTGFGPRHQRRLRPDSLPGCKASR